MGSPIRKTKLKMSFGCTEPDDNQTIEVWLKDGDINSKIFHTSLTVKIIRNVIHYIKDGLKWIQDLKGISEYFTIQFK